MSMNASAVAGRFIASASVSHTRSCGCLRRSLRVRAALASFRTTRSSIRYSASATSWILRARQLMSPFRLRRFGRVSKYSSHRAQKLLVERYGNRQSQAPRLSIVIGGGVVGNICMLPDIEGSTFITRTHRKAKSSNDPPCPRDGVHISVLIGRAVARDNLLPANPHGCVG